MVRLRVVPGQIDVNDPSRRDVAFETLFFSALESLVSASKVARNVSNKTLPYLALPCW